jgi:hypothetical protein
VGYEGLSEFLIYSKGPRKAFDAAVLALQWASKIGTSEIMQATFRQKSARCRLAWLNHLMGQHVRASELFDQVIQPPNLNTSSTSYDGRNRMNGLLAVWHVEYLLYNRSFQDASYIIDRNLDLAESNQWLSELARFNYLKAKFTSQLQPDNTITIINLLNNAVKYARRIQDRVVLIESLLAQGNWFARYGSPIESDGILEEALDYVTVNGIRFYEPDVRTAIAWKEHRLGNQNKAYSQANQALKASTMLSNHISRLAAKEILEILQENE